MTTTYALMDLFAGCGGMTLGFEQTGRFRSVFAVEWDRSAAETYRRNFGEHVHAGAIEQVEDFPTCDVVIGGPPCQGFSPLNMRVSDWNAGRSGANICARCGTPRPAVFVMENVPELLCSAEYHAFADAARAHGYVVDGRILNAADYGVPQRRRRAIVVGSRLGPVRWPEPDLLSPGSHSARR